MLGVLPGLVGTIQATEALKLILGIGDALIGRLLLVDALGMSFRTVRVRTRPQVPGVRHARDHASSSTTTSTAALHLQRRTSTMTRVPEMTPRELADALERGDDLDLLDVREPYEWSLGVLPNARLVPLGALAGAMSTLDAWQAHRGLLPLGPPQRRRGAAACAAAGFRATNLAGGILRWSDDVDPTLPKY